MTRLVGWMAVVTLLFAWGCGDDGGGGGVVTDAGPRCRSDERECGGSCVSTSSDPRHCGGCGMACEPGEVCASGTCASGCPSGTTECSGACVSTSADPRHCGGCGMACEPGELCSASACVLTCGAGLTACEGACVATDHDPAHCGGCGMACDVGEHCMSGTCSSAGCAEPLAVCGDRCVDLQNDPQHCGECDEACSYPGAVPACSSGTCYLLSCAPGFADCNGDESDGCEVRTSDDGANCGACGYYCGFDEACVGGACQVVGGGITSLRVTAFGSTTCSVADHNSTTGDDRGGIAVHPTRYFYNGDNAAGGFEPDDLTMQVALPIRDTMVNDLRGRVWALTQGGSIPAAPGSTVVFDGVVLLDRDLRPVGAPVPLSPPVPRGTSQVALFAGLDFFVFWNGTNALEIVPSTGAVTDLGAVALPGLRGCENWAAWGVAERHGGTTSLLYTSSSTSIRRIEVGTGTQTEIAIPGASDMCSFTLDLARSRWVFHYEGGAPLGGSSFAETIGHCELSFDAP